jgi:hypothetical protein
MEKSHNWLQKNESAHLSGGNGIHLVTNGVSREKSGGLSVFLFDPGVCRRVFVPTLFRDEHRV